MLPDRRQRIPLWLKVAYTLWMAAWVPVYWLDVGPANFLWLCDFANFVVLAALWLESPLLISSQAVSVLLIQLVWMIDCFTRLTLGFHPIGGTEYMFDAAKSMWIRQFSLFHIFIPVLLVWTVWRLGYDRRGWKLQTVLAWILLPLSMLPDPERNLNWLWQPFGIPQTLVPPLVYLVICMAAYPLVLYLPVHWVLRKLAPRAER